MLNYNSSLRQSRCGEMFTVTCRRSLWFSSSILPSVHRIRRRVSHEQARNVKMRESNTPFHVERSKWKERKSPTKEKIVIFLPLSSRLFFPQRIRKFRLSRDVSFKDLNAGTARSYISKKRRNKRMLIRTVWKAI